MVTIIPKSLQHRTLLPSPFLLNETFIKYQIEWDGYRCKNITNATSCTCSDENAALTIYGTQIKHIMEI